MKALYRKYRPIRLDDVIGQEAIVTSLKESLKRGQISHAYLFTGPRGCGKTSVARIFAHEINGFKYELEDSYVDIIEIDAASNTGVDNIRDLREKAAIAPTTGQYKVYIIDEVHMLSKSAFNALLKLLEEPPEHVVFIMATTDPQKVPITITSRAQTYTFRLAEPATMKAHLTKLAQSENLHITPEAIDIVVRRGGGSFRDSISLLDQISTLASGEITAELVNQALGLPQDEVLSRLLSAYVAADASTLTTTLKDLLNFGTKPELLVDELIQKILDNPQPEFLPLLAKLPDVQPPFAEAKLLVALIGDREPSLSSAPSRSAQLPPTPAARIATTPTQSTPPSPPATPEAAAPASPTNTSANFDWQQFLEDIRPENINLYKYLASSKPKISGSTLHIYPEKKIVAHILNSSNNKALLVAHAGGLDIQIHQADEAPRPEFDKDSPLHQISDIMGGVEEVNDSGSPF